MDVHGTTRYYNAKHNSEYRAACALRPPIVALCILALVGCDVRFEEFPSNQVFEARLERTEQTDMSQAAIETQAALELLFGTPDQPQWPEAIDSASSSGSLVNLDNVQRAAGPFRSDEKNVHVGMYREHCVVCHGIAGDGLGPASRLLNPYPRDFRMGVFKFKSTPRGEKPTKADLAHTLTRGLPGTSMPAFRLLSEDDQAALVDYTVYLSVRGEVERQLLAQAAQLDFDAGEHLYDPSQALESGASTEQFPEVVRATTEKVLLEWHEAEHAATSVKLPEAMLTIWDGNHSSDLARSIARGSDIFRGPIANCSKCHGENGSGNNAPVDYDEWTKDWTQRANIDPLDNASLRPMLALGALKPRAIRPRNLNNGAFRGGDQAEDLYLRIVNGIDGTPMPAAPLKPDNPQGLTADEVWDVVNYLKFLQRVAQ